MSDHPTFKSVPSINNGSGHVNIPILHYNHVIMNAGLVLLAVFIAAAIIGVLASLIAAIRSCVRR